MNLLHTVRRLGALLVAAAALGWAQPLVAQPRFVCRNADVSFFSTSIIEDIEARTKQGAAAFDLRTGQVAFSIPINTFEFKRTLMQEHFNENYMETDKFPKATFVGTLTHPEELQNLTEGATQHVEADGDLTLHGVTRRVSVSGTLQMREGRLLCFAFFSVAPADYGVEVPLLVRDHIAKSVSIRVSATCTTQAPALARP